MSLINMTSRDGVILHTAGKYCEEDIAVVPTYESGGEGGDLGINGVIRSYQVNAGKSVSAGDFVEFVTRWGNGEFNTAETNYISAVALSNSKVLIAYADNAKSDYGTAVLLTIDGTYISMGTEFVFKNSATTHISVAALSDSKVIVAYGSPDCRCLVLTIDGTTISKKGEEGTSAQSDTCTSSKIVALSDRKACWVYTVENTVGRNYPFAKILTIDGTAIQGYQALQLYGYSDNNYYFEDLVVLTESKILTVFRSDTKLYAIVLMISDTTVTLASRVNLGYSTKDAASAVALTESKVFVAYADVDNSNFGTAVVLTVDGTTISMGTPVVYREDNTQYIYAVALSDSKVLVTHYGSAIVMTIDGDAISAGPTMIFNPTSTGGTAGTYKGLIAFSSDTVFVAFNYSGIGRYKCLKIEGTTVTVQDTEDNGICVQPATSRLHNVGVAKTGGVGGQMVDVYCVN